MSRVVLDTPVAARGLIVAALSRVTVGAEGLDGRVVGWGRKEMLALLVADGGAVRAIAAGGGPLSEAEVEALSPGAWAAFRAASQHLRG